MITVHGSLTIFHGPLVTVYVSLIAFYD